MRPSPIRGGLSGARPSSMVGSKRVRLWRSISNTRLMSDDRAAHRRSRPSSKGLSRLAGVLSLSEPLRVVRRLGGGLGAATHLLAAGDLRFVLKRYPSDRDVIHAEWTSLMLANDAGLPV